MTYFGFLAAFVVAPLLVVAWWSRRQRSRGTWKPLLLLLLMVYAATTPWDNAAVARGLWDFAPDRIWGVRLWHLPVEEYLFFGLQTLLTGLWVRKRLLDVLGEDGWVRR